MRKSLEEFLSDVGHSWMEHLQGGIKANVKGIEGSSFLASAVTFHHRLDCLKVHIGEVLLPEVIQVVDHDTESVFFKVLVSALDELTKTCEDPAIWEREVSCERRDTIGLGLEVRWEVIKSKLDNVPKLVAELSVANDSSHIKIDRALNHIGEESEAKGIGTTLWNTVRELQGLLLDGLCDFALRQVRLVELLVQCFKIAAI